MSDSSVRYSNLPSRLAWRSLKRYRRRSVICVISISLGLAFAVFYTAMHNGVNASLIEQGIRLGFGQVILEHSSSSASAPENNYLMAASAIVNELKRLDGVKTIRTQIAGQGMARSAYDSQAVEIRGVDVVEEGEEIPYAQSLIEGEWWDDRDQAQVIIGKRLARRLHLNPGKKMILTTNDFEGNLVEQLCRIQGIFETGVEMPDGHLVLVPLRFSRGFFGLPVDSVTRIGVVPDRYEDEARLVAGIRRISRDMPIKVLTWKQVLPDLASYLRVDRSANFIFQGILVVVILFTIFNTVLMSVLDRKQEFGIMLSLGTPPSLIRLQLLMESFWLGLIGCCMGIILGGSVSYYFQIKGLNAGWVYGTDLTISGFWIAPVIYARVTWELPAVFGTVMLGLILLTSFIPIRYAAAVPLTETLKQD